MLAIDKGHFRERGSRPSSRTSGRRATGSRRSRRAPWRSAISAASPPSSRWRAATSFRCFANIDDSPAMKAQGEPGFDGCASPRRQKVAANTSAEITMNGLLECGHDKKGASPFSEPAPLSRDGDGRHAWQGRHRCRLRVGTLLTNIRNGTPTANNSGSTATRPASSSSAPCRGARKSIISRKLVNEHPDLARKLTAAIFKGVAFTNAHPEETAETVAHYFNKPPAEELAAIKMLQIFRRG